jgi:hypothetical protein
LGTLQPPPTTKAPAWIRTGEVWFDTLYRAEES